MVQTIAAFALQEATFRLFFIVQEQMPLGTQALLSILRATRWE